ncbi:uncharacterized protein SCHCODRAFT_02645284 [Schizophyllum commune H4-8]|uniref:uncharacterized protein n=1 Tax=Schizophyllum commune (strain H4-8 / FGSC 9210) TaxID=578458 RepID=UPI00215EB9BF|nr:uncharacterized protein SCHCODRAFT_02645284 [Schizophyllum commune H4-8]KAI5885165.1 hypothetical protein SCHCODRAFT_02645284 [Schizophyllum commune H4-8]
MRMLEGVAQARVVPISEAFSSAFLGALIPRRPRATAARLRGPKTSIFACVCLRPLLALLEPVLPDAAPLPTPTPPWSLFCPRAGATNLRVFGQRRRHHPYSGQSHKLCVPLRVVAVGGCRSRI